MALEYYDSFFRRYPAEVAAEAARTIAQVRAAFAAAAQKEAADVHQRLAHQVAEPSVAIARRMTARPAGIHGTAAFAVAVAFGGCAFTRAITLH